MWDWDVHTFLEVERLSFFIIVIRYTFLKIVEKYLYDIVEVEVQSLLHNKTTSSNLLTFCGFRKPHPHIDKSYIRLGFTNSTTPTDIVALLVNSLGDIRNIFQKISTEFKN